ncbi:hybrid sensor histidine kinase/response regulator [Methyloversatilis universalis]|uniref:hybrid sensor histidine kinase/response regulator n=1 Tax=Methyloversatilis universalis TaxID=378211 RepID=UPI00037AC646|nr:Hpt domain-containing protein [Methyloversatilis universalis]
MSTSSSEQDLGPLIWVRGEIDLALVRAAEALGDGRHAAGAEALKFAQTHLHQARGALAIVGLDGLTHFCDALEQLFADWHAGKLSDTDNQAGPVAQRAISAVRSHLDELVAGGVDQPMRLMPLYRDLMAARGESVVAPSELFFPDLTRRPAGSSAAAAALSPLDRSRALRAARSQFERGLLRFLRDDRDGLVQMRQAVGAIEQTQTAPATRAFWWVIGALFEGMAQGAIQSDFFVKRLCARVDVQMRRLLEGSRGVAERLMRDSLYFIASASQSTPALRAVRDTYALDALVASEHDARDDIAALRPAIAALRESLGQAKDAWTRFSSGAAVALPQFHEQCEAMVAASTRVGQPDLARLAAALLDLGQWLRRDPLQHQESLAMEVATALLVMDALIEQFSRAQADDLPAQVDTLVDRLARARRGEELPAMQIPLFDEMSRKAQERLFMGQVAREILASLGEVEQHLDAYFRNPARAPELAGLSAPLKQVEGALNMLGQDSAVALVRRSAQQIARMAQPDHVAAEGEFETLAHQLSGLGFFVDKLQYGPADLDIILNPRGSAQAREAPVGADADGVTVENELAARRAEATQLLDRLARGGADDSTRDELRQALETMRQDAKLLADEKLEKRVAEALAALKAGDTPVAEAVQALADSPADSLAPSADTVRLAEASQEEFDAELLEIFIEEAREVLDTIAAGTVSARQAPHSQDLLTTLRRGFHTLKGSGRMVGLRDLGEAAYAVEQVMNRWLASERDGTPELFDLLDRARSLFAGWVDMLTDGNTQTPPHDWLTPACAALLGEPEAATGTAPAPAPDHALDLELDGGLDFNLDEEEALEAAGLPGTSASNGQANLDDLADIFNDASLAETTIVPDVLFASEPPAAPEPLALDIDFDLELAPPTDAETLDITELPEDDAAAASVEAIEPIDITADIDAEDLALDAGADRTLFDLFVAEARGHLATLRRELARLHVNPSLLPTQDSLIAAHTLGGISLTVGEHDISLLAKALEHALQRCESHGQPPADHESALLNTAAGTLESQVNAVAASQPAVPVPDLVARLDALFMLPVTPVELPVFELPPSVTPEPADTGARSVLSDLAGFRRGLDDEGQLLPEPVVEPEVEPESEPETASVPEAGPVTGIDDLTDSDLPWEDGDASDASADAVSPEVAETVDAIDLIGLTELDASAAEPEQDAHAEAPPAEPEYSPAAASDQGEDSSALLLDGDDMAFEKVALPDEYVLPPPENTLAVELPRPSPLPVPPRLPAADDTPRVADDIDPQLLPIFLEEAHDLLGEIGHELRAWREEAGQLSASDALRRQLHTLKGSARMAGVMRFGDLVHSMEGVIEVPCSEDDRGLVLDELELAYDRCEELVGRLERGETVEPAAATAQADGGTTDAPAAIAADEEAGTVRERPTVRVRSDMVDRFVNEAGEMSIARTRIEGELRALRGSLNDLTENVQRLRGQLREIEIHAESQMQSRMAAAEAHHEQFDPLEMDRFTRLQELSRLMTESLSDVTTVQYNLVRNLDAADTAIQSQARLNRELSQALMSVRMVPFSTLEDRLYRVARQSAKELGKKVNLELRNTQIELDREVLEKMTGPIEHLLRNAVAHGVESREARVAAGKSETGEIVITLTQQTNEVEIELADDGAGLAFERIRARGVERGLLAADEVVDERRLTGLIFEPGFTTAAQVSELAGRGVGMDVVKNATSALGGRIETVSESGQGTRFRLSLPMTLAVTQSVLVSSGGKTYAIPSSMVQHARELKGESGETLRDAGGQEWLGTHYRYQYLPRLLGERQSPPAAGSWVLLISSGHEFMALEVDALRGNQEVVVKPVGPQLSKLVGISGATVLPDGEVTLIINPVAIAARNRLDLAARGHAGADLPDVPAMPAATADETPLVMVVDDSLTVRKITSRLLEREGYRVVTAKDGVDALEKLIDAVPDVMLVDIEMPRMDGFDLTRNVRADARTRDVPIIMITSRTAEKHKAYAREIGVNHYLGKPYNEQELLELIAGHTGRDVLLETPPE